MGFSFRLTHTDGLARRGELRTAHGVVQTPAFMPVGTRGAVKAVTHRDLRDLGAEIILGNTYHLYLKPGDDLIARRGGELASLCAAEGVRADPGGQQAGGGGGPPDAAQKRVQVGLLLDDLGRGLPHPMASLRLHA